MLTTFSEARDAAKLRESLIKKDPRNGDARFLEQLERVCRKERVTLANTSVREVFEAFVGREALDELRPQRSHSRVLMEAGGAVNTAAFSNIMGVLTYSSVMESFDSPEFIGSSLMPTVSSSTQNAEIIPGFEMLGDEAEDVGELEEYPVIGFGEDWVTSPKKVKDGFIVPISREVIWEDRTGDIQARASRGAESMAITMEKEKLDCVVGAVDTYRRKDGAVEATYANSHAFGTFDNLVVNPLVDYTSIDTILRTFNGFNDPVTGEPIVLGRNLVLVVPRALLMTAYRVQDAVTMQLGDTTQGTTPVAMFPNLLNRVADLTIVSNEYVGLRSGSDTTYFAGNPARAFEYRENWPVQVEYMPQNAHVSFTRDIVFGMKVSRKGVPFCKEPRYMMKCTAS